MAAFQRLALLDMGLEVADVATRLRLAAGAAGKPDTLQSLAHAAVCVAIARGIDLGLAQGPDIRAAAEEAAKMAFLVAPGGDFDSALGGGIWIEHAGGFQRVDDPERPIEPASIVLALQVRAREQFWPGLGAGAEHISDAVDFGCKAGVRQLLRQPLQGVHVRL